jgi:hypothetical protein
MAIAVWICGGIASWLVLAVVMGLLVGRIIGYRDGQPVPGRSEPGLRRQVTDRSTVTAMPLTVTTVGRRGPRYGQS